MRVFKTKWFTRFARREHLSDEVLKEAIARAERGLIDADLGGGLIKQRVARKGVGRSGGFRTLIAHKQRSRSVFLYGFAKSERENIEPDELQALRTLAQRLLGAEEAELEVMLSNNQLAEVKHEEGK